LQGRALEKRQRQMEGSLRGLSLLERGFFRLGQFVSRRPGLVSVICLILTSLSVIGIYTSVVIVTSPQEIWVPPGSTTGVEKAYFDDKFSPFYRIEQVNSQPYGFRLSLTITWWRH